MSLTTYYMAVPECSQPMKIIYRSSCCLGYRAGVSQRLFIRQLPPAHYLELAGDNV